MENPVPLTDLSFLLHNQATNILLLDQHFRLLYLNEAAERLLNTSAKRVEGMVLTQLVKDDDQLTQACRRALAEHNEIRLRNHELMLPAMVLVRTVDCIVTPITHNDQDLVLLECNAADEPGNMTRDEEFAERQRSNREVIRGMAHEIRNPLGGIRGAAQLMAEEAGSEAFGDYTRIIIEETDRLTELVNRMQADTRVDLDQAINIHSVLEDVRQLVEAENSGSLRIEKDYDPSLPPVRGNRDLLVQASMNVIRNAAESVEDNAESGVVTLRTRIDRLPTDRSSRSTRQVVRIEVEDNGAGVPQELAGRIFDPMVTNKASGSGLGLPITAEIVAQHDGVIDFRTQPDKTVFRLYIPIFSGSTGLQEAH